MSNINKQALREAAEKANPEQYGYYLVDAFTEMVTPNTVLALLDELEAKDAQIAELLEKQRLIDICQGQGLEHRIAAEKRAEAAEKRIAELEARTVTVELPRGYAGPYGSLAYDADAVEAALELAGINLETGGE